MVACVTEPVSARTVTVVAVDTAEVWIGNVPVVLPCPIVIEAGTVTAGVSADSVTTIPAVGAGALRVTVPLAEMPAITDAGFRAIDATVGKGCTVRVAV